MYLRDNCVCFVLKCDVYNIRLLNVSKIMCIASLQSTTLMWMKQYAKRLWKSRQEASGRVGKAH